MTEYESYEIRFHTPSEHILDGKKYEMEMEVMFESITEDEFRKKAAIGFLIK